MEKLKTSEPTFIMRSQINLNPINPKRHTSDAIKLQAKNLKRVGYLGGIVWNEKTGNLVDGHRRVYALDSINGYPEKDYELRVEKATMSEYEEKKQLTYMSVGNTKPDLDLIAEYIGEINTDDFSQLGLSESELSEILSINDKEVEIPELDGLLEPAVPMVDERTDEEKKQHVKDVKAKIADGAESRENGESAFIMLSFSDSDAKAAFCDIVGCNMWDRVVKGEDVLKHIE